MPSWVTPHTAGYSAARNPIRAGGRPWATNRTGNSPQARPSLRLSTIPACEAADRVGSLKPMRVKICHVVSGLTTAPKEGTKVFYRLAGSGVARPSVSQHLVKLRLAGLVRTRRDGRRVLYRASDAHARELIAEARFHADHEVSGIPRHED